MIQEPHLLPGTQTSATTHGHMAIYALFLISEEHPHVPLVILVHIPTQQELLYVCSVTRANTHQLLHHMNAFYADLELTVHILFPSTYNTMRSQCPGMKQRMPVSYKVGT